MRRSLEHYDSVALRMRMQGLFKHRTLPIISRTFPIRTPKMFSKLETSNSFIYQTKHTSAVKQVQKQTLSQQSHFQESSTSLMQHHQSFLISETCTCDRSTNSSIKISRHKHTRLLPEKLCTTKG